MSSTSSASTATARVPPASARIRGRTSIRVSRGSSASADRLHLALLPLFLEPELLDLAGAGHGEGLDDEPVLRRLVRRKMLAHVGGELVLVDGGAGGGPDEGGHCFAQALVGQPDHRDLAHARMPEEQLLE